MRKTVFILGAICWLAFAVGFLVFLGLYVLAGAGVQYFAWMISPTSVLVGLVHVVGLVAAAALCFVVGAGLFAHGMAPQEKEKQEGYCAPDFPPKRQRRTEG